MPEIKINTESLVSLSEAARLLNISRPTLYKRIEEKQINVVHVGMSRFLMWDDVNKLRVTNGDKSQ